MADGRWWAEYGDSWEEMWRVSFEDNEVVDCEGDVIAEIRDGPGCQRAALCVNALFGVPSEMLLETDVRPLLAEAVRKWREARDAPS